MRKTRTTDQLLTLGMALTTDRRTMERRVRGVFARKKSAKGVLILSIMLALALGFAAFTTACQPGKAAVVLTPIPVEQEANGLPQCETEVSAAEEPDATAAPMQWRSFQYLIGSMVESQFQYPISPKHIDEPKIDYGNGVSLLVNADVVIPQAAGYGVRQCDGIGFAIDDYLRMIDYFLPNANWVPNQTEPGFQTNGAYDFADIDFSSNTILSVEQDGEMFSVGVGMDQHIFSFSRAGGIVYREGYLVGDEEMERDFGAVIREPIALTREAAQAQADQVLADLGIRGWQLDKAERACMFEDGNSSNVLSRGWDFGYVLSSAGLPARGNSGWLGMKYDSLDYCTSDAGSLWIYVDDRGVSFFYWINRYEPREAMYTNVEIIGVDAALTLAKARLARIFGGGYTGVSQIELFEIRLSSMLIAYPDELDANTYYDDELRDMAFMIPAWNASCCLTYNDGDIEYINMPFSATDGGAISMLYF